MSCMNLDPSGKISPSSCLLADVTDSLSFTVSTFGVDIRDFSYVLLLGSLLSNSSDIRKPSCAS